MALDSKDFEQIERMVYKCTGDIAVALGRSFERLEERIDAAESRLYGRLAEVDDRIVTSRQEMAGEFGDFRKEMRLMDE